MGSESRACRGCHGCRRLCRRLCSGREGSVMTRARMLALSFRLRAMGVAGRRRGRGRGVGQKPPGAPGCKNAAPAVANVGAGVSPMVVSALQALPGTLASTVAQLPSLAVAVVLDQQVIFA